MGSGLDEEYHACGGDTAGHRIRPDGVSDWRILKRVQKLVTRSERSGQEPNMKWKGFHRPSAQLK